MGNLVEVPELRNRNFIDLVHYGDRSVTPVFGTFPDIASADVDGFDITRDASIEYSDVVFESRYPSDTNQYISIISESDFDQGKEPSPVVSIAWSTTMTNIGFVENAARFLDEIGRDNPMVMDTIGVGLRMRTPERDDIIARWYEGKGPVTIADLQRDTLIGERGSMVDVPILTMGNNNVAFQWAPNNTVLRVRPDAFKDGLKLEGVMERYYARSEPDIPKRTFSRALAHGMYNRQLYPRVK